MLCAPSVIYTFNAKYTVFLTAQYVTETRNLHMLQTFAHDGCCVYLNARQSFVLKFGASPSMWGCLKFAYEAPNWTAPKHIALNQIMQSETKACITKSCGAVLFWDIALCRVVILPWHFGSVYQYKFQGLGNLKERTEHKRSSLKKSSFLGLYYHLIS